MIPALFTSALANHLWQSTGFAAVAALLVLLLRNNHARTRYWLWLIASIKFLIPFSLFVALGTRLEWPAVHQVAQPAVTVAIQQITQPFLLLQSAPISSPTPTHSASLILPLLWLCGFLAVAFSWWRRWHRIHAAVRAASPLACIDDVPVLSTPALLEPGVFGIFRPVLLLPQGITDRLTPAHLEAILSHELCHIRRRDNLAAALHMFVEAIFWFHPLVWWLGVRLVEEREHACDEEVLRLGRQPEVYAESILKTCQFYLESPLTCVSGISGADLKKRIVRIMSQHLATQLSPTRKLVLAVAGIAAIAGPILIGAQSQPANPTPRPSFEVASVKPNKTGDRGIRIQNQPGRFSASNISLKTLIEFAYRLKGDSELSGATGWISSENYDIDAKPEVPPPGAPKLTFTEEEDRRRLMIQSLLADRFKLAVRHEAKDLPIYALVVAKNGPKLTQSAVQSDPPLNPTPGSGPRRGAMMGIGELTLQTTPIAMLCDALSRQLGRPVVDQTGLKGNYDLTLKWTPDEGQRRMFGPPDGDRRDAPPPPDPSGPTIFTALQEQLGLKLESQKGPVDTIVIEHAERPSEN